MTKSRVFVLLTLAAGVVAVIIVASQGPVYAMAFGLVFLLAVEATRYPNFRARRRCLRVLRARPEGDWRVECALLEGRTSIGAEDLARLWEALAHFYGVRPAKIRSDDRVDAELLGLIQHVDYDPFFTRLSYEVGERAETTGAGIRTWADVLVFFRRWELAANRSATKTVQRAGNVTYEWAD